MAASPPESSAKTLADRSPSALSPKLTTSLALAVIAALTLARLAVLAGGHVPLFGDEAQYWVWAQEPAFGYFSKPPLIAWLIAVTTALFGDSGFGVRIGALLCHLGTAAVLYRIGLRLQNRETGLWAAVTWLALPAVTVSSIAMSTDAPLLFFWAVGLYAVLEALHSGDGRWWLLFGIAFGFGMLSKFAMGYALPCLAIALLATSSGRLALKSRWLWAGLALGLLIILPNLVWQQEHRFVTVAHIAEDSNVRGFALDFAEAGEFVTSQLGVFGPITMVALLATLGMLRRASAAMPTLRVLHAFTWPPLLIITGIALMGSANANWAATAYVAATLLVVLWAREGGKAVAGLTRVRHWLLPTALGLHLAIAAIAYLWHPVAEATGVTLTRKTDFLARQRGFEQLAAAIAPDLAAAPGTALVTDHRMLFALMAYHLRPAPILAMWPDRPGQIRNHFDIAAPFDRIRPDPAFFLSADLTAAEIRDVYAAATLRRRVDIEILPGYTRSYALWYLAGLKP